MGELKFLVLAAIAALAGVPGAAKVKAQIDFYIGVAPICPYGYFSYVPHNCVPDGYYGPEWFHDGVFIGAGSWFHGPENFRGLVDNTLDPQYGYHGPLPKAGDKPAAQRRAEDLFKGNEVRDGHGDIHGERQGGKT
jgi:hypothetical protein